MSIPCAVIIMASGYSLLVGLSGVQSYVSMWLSTVTERASGDQNVFFLYDAVLLRTHGGINHGL